MSDNKKKSFALRVSPEMYDALEKWAADEFRSVNGQIEFLLNEALKKNGRIKKNGRNKKNHTSS
ncbi:MAG TPA: Arc family DNA-binding protein [Saprospiraceae bacterium]|nr:Arc family DNA-binding protein [Saprospiraceae bacterium]